MKLLLVALGLLLVGCVEKYDTTTADVGRDKSVCAASGIELLDYYKHADAYDAEGMGVSYLGREHACSAGAMRSPGSCCEVLSLSACISVCVNGTHCMLKDTPC